MDNSINLKSSTADEVVEYNEGTREKRRQIKAAHLVNAGLDLGSAWEISELLYSILQVALAEQTPRNRHGMSGVYLW